MMRPEEALDGTLVVIEVDVAETTVGKLAFNITRLFEATVSKLVPEIVIEVDASPRAGLKLVIVGCPLFAVTVKVADDDADPAGEVTLIVPLVAPAGTMTTNSVAVAELTTAVVPLKRTVFRFAVGLKPVPFIWTVVPTVPCDGVKPVIETCDDEFRTMESGFPTASYE